MFPSDAPPRALAAFDVLQRLGAGGVGEVFLARSRAGKLVAIKTIADPSRDGHEGETADAFAREARAIPEGKSEERPIYGEASGVEVKKLLEDGVPVAALPPRALAKKDVN